MIRTGFSLAVAVGLVGPVSAADPPQVHETPPVEFRSPDPLPWRTGEAREAGWQPAKPPEVPVAVPPKPVVRPDTKPADLPLNLVPTTPRPLRSAGTPFRRPPVQAVTQIEPLPLPIPNPQPSPPPPKPVENPTPIPPPVTRPMPDAGTPPKLPPTSDPLPPPRPAPESGTPTPASTASEGVIWGSYVPSGTAAKPTPPVRHHTFGSPNLRLSRDYHFLDAFTAPLTADDETVVMEDKPAGSRGYVQAEFLYWWVNRSNIPVLASTATAGGNGFLGAADTQVLLGPGAFGPSGRTGFRVRAGTWLDACQTCGIDASYFTLGRATQSAVFPSSQFPTLARPFFAANLNQEFAELVARPGLSTGTLNVRQSSELWGADVNLRKALICGCDRRLEGFVGYRHLNLSEDLAVTEFIQAGPNAPDPEGTRIVVQDRFATTNRFHGGQVGVGGFREFGRVSLFGRASIGFGNTRQTIDIQGFQVRTLPGGQPENFRGGLLAAGPNLGRFTRDRFSVVPEVTLNIGYAITPRFSVYAGYNFLGWTNVLRPGDQIDRVVDTTFVPNFTIPGAVRTANRPVPTFRQSDLWVNGIQAGVEFRW